MKVLNRIGKMAETAWHDTAERFSMNEQGGGFGSQTGASGRIRALEQRYEETLQRTFELRQHFVNAEELARLRAEQAELAMRAGEEELARAALQEKLRLEAACGHYRTQYASSQDEVLALAEELQRLRAAGADDVQPHGGLHGAQARDTLRELENAGREAWQGLREAGRMSAETLKEAGCNVKQELRTMRVKLQKEWQQSRSSGERGGPRAK